MNKLVDKETPGASGAFRGRIPGPRSRGRGGGTSLRLPSPSLPPAAASALRARPQAPDGLVLATSGGHIDD
ncbi:hypothetical protein, partial [Streptomyces syringium]|uniref:hypothetical protein n=1 Tax=Streptomyces syringium TaxID=76729 RepID=UPI00344A5B9F